MSTNINNYIQGLRDKVKSNQTLTEEEASDYVDSVTSQTEEKMAVTKEIALGYSLKFYSPQNGKIPVELYYFDEAIKCADITKNTSTKSNLIEFRHNQKSYKLSILMWGDKKHEIDAGIFETGTPRGTAEKLSWRWIEDITMVGYKPVSKKKEITKTNALDLSAYNVSILNEAGELFLDMYSAKDDLFIDSVSIVINRNAGYISTIIKLEDENDYRIGLMSSDNWKDDISVGLCPIGKGGAPLTTKWVQLPKTQVEIIPPAKSSTDGVIASADRDIKKELQGLKLNIRITESTANKGALDIALFNHAVQIHNMTIQNSWPHSSTIFEMYKNQYEIALFSSSRNLAHRVIKDDFVASVAVYDTEKAKTVGTWVTVDDVSYVDNGVVTGETVLDNKKDATKLGSIDNWNFFRTADKTEYFFKKGRKLIVGSTLQLAVEKFGLSIANTKPRTLEEIKNELGFSEVQFVNDFSISERQDAIRKELIKVAADKKESYDDYLARIAITAMRELSTSQRKSVQEKIEMYSKDPESVLDEEMGVAL